jgi:hypothetical protein
MKPSGVIKKRGNSWWFVVYAGRDPLTGRKGGVQVAVEK